MIETLVGTKRRLVPLDAYSEIHGALSEKFSATGLEGEELDEAIVTALPAALAKLIN